jgi:MFS family permease
MRRMFGALALRNYRLYFTGQTISVSGTWMQTVALGWLVLQITGSGVAVGTTLAMQFVPVLVAGPWGGVIADRFDKRHLLYATQVSAGALALVLGLLTLTGAVELWMIYLLAFGLGCSTVVDNPARQTFVFQMVGRERLANAVSLNSVVMNVSRVVGPAIGGVLIATVGLSTCFFVNAASYLAVILALSLMRTSELGPSVITPRAKGQLREGFRYVWRTPALRTPLLMMAAIGTLSYEFQVLLPLMAKFEFDSGAGGYAALTAAMGAGSVIGGLITARQKRSTPQLLTGSAIVFGALVIATSLMPSQETAMVALVLTGAVSISFIVMSNTTLQFASEPEMRGRVMALFAVAFLGSTPIGGPIVGAIAQATSPRLAMLIGGVTAVVAGVIGRRSLVARDLGPGDLLVEPRLAG